MTFNPEVVDNSTLYKLLTGTVIPRPIGWISTVDENGINNLAPFSYFNMVSSEPPCVMFSTRRDNNQNKDTLNNVLKTGQFVANLVSVDIAEQMNTTSAPVAPNVDEFQLAGVTPVDSLLIAPKRVKESKVNFECEMVHHHFIKDKNGNETACVVIGEIKMIHIDDAILTENNHINMEVYQPVARLAGSFYGTLGELFSIKRAT
ncbi:flavin reductase family protein [Flavobacterium capsici]|uniref:Flavin reductase family protein n=1 Tax=Flavobacterium capsici TaxID=3075618 RepID=A0AA96ET26_9FLAO|nr:MULTISPECIES: flavin reductase family protein [unclassified Flavobacterium]WNM17943.1 flavin reductase family protein [Flavobacterium sp. PMR2A8]WNM21995.1 flavin reductase family protein [Flavobacterium sp. PMTSA4]